MGVGRRTLALAAAEVFGDRADWKRVFDDPTVALWFVSDVSDASMRAAFTRVPARGMAEVIDLRLDQNVSLKPFVRRVMAFDMLHPFQALARMQRTAGVMFACLPPGQDGPGFFRLALLNLAYTGVVFIWLADRSAGDRRTKALTLKVMRWLAL